ncbi:MAG: carboxymuconolactone decarboxylase family protein [Bauldia sp.]|nr:carboxymuconolactone decarboxylase family protein [Bauldia sp.]
MSIFHRKNESGRVPGRRAVAAFSGLALALAAGLGTGAAQEVPASAAAAYEDIRATAGFVPSFVYAFPESAIAGAWAELKALEFSDDTALDARTKALISLAVSAQIPCQYCIWLDTNSARAAGASDQEIREAVAISALTRHWSTVFNGMQVDFETFKREFGGEAAMAVPAP